jgi:hypothetical protein
VSLWSSFRDKEVLSPFLSQRNNNQVYMNVDMLKNDAFHSLRDALTYHPTRWRNPTFQLFGSIVIEYPVFSLHSLFWKNKSRLMRSRYCLCVCLCIPPCVARKHLGKCPILVARQRFGTNPLIVARQRVGKNPPSLLGNGSVETLPQ